MFRRNDGTAISTHDRVVRVVDGYHEFSVAATTPTNAVTAEVRYVVGNGSGPNTVVVLGVDTTEASGVRLFPKKKDKDVVPMWETCPELTCECNIDCAPLPKVEVCDEGVPPTCFQTIECKCGTAGGDDIAHYQTIGG